MAKFGQPEAAEEEPPYTEELQQVTVNPYQLIVASVHRRYSHQANPQTL